jgi:sulfur carrier protein ThiS
VISVRVKIFGGLRRYTDNKRVIEIEIKSNTAISEIIQRINVPDAPVYAVEKNGKVVNKRTIVDKDCELTLIPFISGG